MGWKCVVIDLNYGLWWIGAKYFSKRMIIIINKFPWKYIWKKFCRNLDVLYKGGLEVILQGRCHFAKMLWWRGDAATFYRRIPITKIQLYEASMFHYNDVIMSAMASPITSLTIVYSAVYSGANQHDQRKHQSSESLAFERGIHRSPVNSPHKWPVTRKMYHFDDVIMLFVSRNATEMETSFRHFRDWLHRTFHFDNFRRRQ